MKKKLSPDYIQKHLLLLLFVWFIVYLLIKIIFARFQHAPLFKWYRGNAKSQQHLSCISPWKVALAVDLPSLVTSTLSKPFGNTNTPNFLTSLATRYGTIKKMPFPAPVMSIDDWCVGISARLYNYAGNATVDGNGNIFGAGPLHTETIQGVNVNVWALSNLALSVNGGRTILTGYEVYHKYGSPLAWQPPQWKGWLECRLRPPAFPIWKFLPNNPNSVFHTSYNPQTDIATGDFEWGSPFVQTGYLSPYGCQLSGCAKKPSDCGSVQSSGSGNEPTASCKAIGEANHKKLPWVLPHEVSISSNFYTTQTPANNPFMAFNIRPSSPLILRFLGYGFESQEEKEPLGPGKGTIVFRGGPSEDQYVQVDQFMTLVNNGGFFSYAERDSNQDIAQLENYLFGYFTFTDDRQPAPKGGCSPGGSKLIGGAISGGIGGSGAGVMLGTALGGPIGAGIGAAVGAGLGIFGGIESAKGSCGSGHGGCSIM